MAAMGLIHCLQSFGVVNMHDSSFFCIHMIVARENQQKAENNEMNRRIRTIQYILTCMYDYVVCIVFGNVRSAGCLCHPTSEVNCTYNYLTEQEVETNNRTAHVSVSTYMYTVSRLCTPYTCYIHICMYLTAGYVTLTNIETSLHRPLDGMYIRVLLCKTNTHASI